MSNVTRTKYQIGKDASLGKWFATEAKYIVGNEQGYWMPAPTAMLFDTEEKAVLWLRQRYRAEKNCGNKLLSGSFGAGYIIFSEQQGKPVLAKQIKEQQPKLRKPAAGLQPSPSPKPVLRKAKRSL